MIENKLIIYSVFIPLVVILFLIFLFISYKKGEKNKTFTIRTISIFVIFSGLSIALSYWSITIIPHVLSFSFSTIPVMYIGFLLGPKEGFIFGLFTDTIKSLIKGYPWMFVYALTEPIMGLISGYVGLNKEKYKTKKYKIALIIFVQIFFLLLFILSMTLINVQDVFGAKEWGGIVYIDESIRKIINIVVPDIYLSFEVIYVFLYFKKMKNDLLI
ncbi:MAG: ECF transporter S component [Mycoplasmataceae bacterium]|nr:ECF transporter S component [Mycoplasmataceae bacterium]